MFQITFSCHLGIWSAYIYFLRELQIYRFHNHFALLCNIVYVLCKMLTPTLRKFWRYQRDNQKSSIERQTVQWTKEKEQTMIYKTLHRQLLIEQHEYYLKPGETQVYGRVNRSWSTIDTINYCKKEILRWISVVERYMYVMCKKHESGIVIHYYVRCSITFMLTCQWSIMYVNPHSNGLDTLYMAICCV